MKASGVLLMVIPDDKIDYFSKLPREETIALPDDEKMMFFYSLQVKHQRLEGVAKDLYSLLAPFNETNILSLIGATGSGKTSLARILLKSLVKKVQEARYSEISDVPFIYIPAPASGNKSISWVTVYESILKRGHEILPEKKQVQTIGNGLLTVKPKRYKTLAALQASLLSMFENRKVRVLVIDEAYHLLRFGNFSAVMDILKTIVDISGVKILLVGTYDLFDLVTDYGQVARRSEILHLDRYHIDKPKDCIEYQKAITKMQGNWPCEEIPAFHLISKELMEASLGCIGLLKTILLRSLSSQLENKGKWDPKFLAKAAKADKLYHEIRKEIELGEDKVKNACYGESIFTGEILNQVVEKMNCVVVNA